VVSRSHGSGSFLSNDFPKCVLSPWELIKFILFRKVLQCMARLVAKLWQSMFGAQIETSPVLEEKDEIAKFLVSQQVKFFQTLIVLSCVIL